MNSSVTNHYSTKWPERHRRQRGPINWQQFVLQLFIRFPEFVEFNESSIASKKNSIESKPAAENYCIMLSNLHFFDFTSTNITQIKDTKN